MTITSGSKYRLKKPKFAVTYGQGELKGIKIVDHGTVYFLPFGTVYKASGQITEIVKESKSGYDKININVLKDLQTQFNEVK